jgi:F0F1-type ATP synthase assembly protein I
VIAWSSTPARAIGGLRMLLDRPEWRGSAHAPAIRAVLYQRVADPDETIRMLTAQAIHLIQPTDGKRLSLIRDRLLAETHSTVRAILLSQLGFVLSSKAAEVDQLLAELGRSADWLVFATRAATARLTSDNASTEEATDEAFAEGERLRVAVQLVLVLALRHQQAFAVELVGRWFAHPLEYPQIFKHTVYELRNLGMLDPSRQEAVAARTFALLRQATEPLVATVEEQASAVVQEPEVLRSAVQLADAVVDQIYFASGALDDRRTATAIGDRQSRVARGGVKLFYELSMPLLERLVQVRYPSITHRIVETLAYLADYDPKRVFLAVHDAVTPAQGYEYERMGVDLVIGLIKLYLADYRDILTSDEACLIALREILEAFVRVGWPSAVALAYELPDAFR